MPQCLTPATYTIRLTRRNAGICRLDCLDIVPRVTPVENTSWGRIKALYAEN